MSSRLSSDRVRELAPLLGSIARLIAHGGSVTREQLQVLLEAGDIGKSARVLEELERWAKLLRKVSKSPNRSVREAVVEGLLLRGLPEATVLLAIATVTGGEPSSVEPPNETNEVGLTASVSTLDFGLLGSGETATKEFEVRGGPGEITSGTDQFDIKPRRFRSKATRIQVTAKPLSSGVAMDTLNLITKGQTVAVSVIAQWQEAGQPEPETSRPDPAPVFNFPNGRQAQSVQELVQLCAECPDDAKIRLRSGEIGVWLAFIGRDDLAAAAERARRVADSDEGLKRFLDSTGIPHGFQLPPPLQSSGMYQPQAPVPAPLTQPVVPMQKQGGWTWREWAAFLAVGVAVVGVGVLVVGVGLLAVSYPSAMPSPTLGPVAGAASGNQAPATSAPSGGQPTATSAPSAGRKFTCTDKLGCVDIGPNEPVHIAYNLVTSGDNADLGIDIKYGAELAIDDAGGQVLGHTIKFDGQDSACSTEGGQAAAIKIAADKTVVAVIGTDCSSAARASIPILIQQAGLTMISPANTAPDLTDPARHVTGYFRTSHNDKVQGAVAAQFVSTQLKFKTAATIHDGSIYAQGLVSVFVDDFQKAGGKVTNQEAVNVGDKDMKPVLTRIAANKPQLIYFPIFVAEGGFIASQVRDVPGLEHTVLMGADGIFSPDFIKAGGKNVLGFFWSSPNFATFGSGYDALVAKYKKKYNVPGVLAPFHAHAYDAMNMVLAALQKPGVVVKDADGTLHVQKQALRDAIAATKDFKGITGNLTCDPNGDCADPKIAVYQETADDLAKGQTPSKPVWAPGGPDYTPTLLP
ncbi:MAG: branched-chain amino acid ABC transporter substrate-binding protein [Chloroflexi bacterium]|nr:branched-chain amino acid ABC transporter substrate-binding protein [Chloroflexota bacterium]